MKKYKAALKSKVEKEIVFKGFFSKAKNNLVQEAFETSYGWIGEYPLFSFMSCVNTESFTPKWLEVSLRNHLKLYFKPSPKGFIDSIFWSYIVSAVIDAIVKWLVEQYRNNPSLLHNISKEN